MIRRWLSKEKPRVPAARLPADLRVYAVGDLHGRLDLLEKLHEKVSADRAAATEKRSIEIFLGDYIDRGPASCQVIDWLITSKPVADIRVCLKGNHEEAMKSFLRDPGTLHHWAKFGGLETLVSYGLSPSLIGRERDAFMLRDALAAALPQSHRDFLEGLHTTYEIGDYFFVHAGIRPGIPLGEQTEQDVLGIRQPFLSSKQDHGKIIVHGHTPVHAPEVLTNRINLDTGAFATGVLTCAVLDIEGIRFIDTA